MKTILYNIIENKIIGNLRDGYYLVDGQRPIIPNHIELIYEDIEPNYNSEKEYIDYVFEVDLVHNKYIKSYTKHDIIVNDWDFPEWSKRIIAPIQILLQIPEFEVWFRLNDLPILRRKRMLYAYCNVILPEHQSVIDSLNGIIVVEDQL